MKRSWTNMSSRIVSYFKDFFRNQFENSMAMFVVFGVIGKVALNVVSVTGKAITFLAFAGRRLK